MLFNVLDSSENIIGHVEADNPVDAWQKAREIYEATGSMVFDVRRETPKETLLRLSGITPHEITEEERMMEEWEREVKFDREYQHDRRLREIKIVIRSWEASDEQLNNLANRLQEMAWGQLVVPFRYSITVE